MHTHTHTHTHTPVSVAGVFAQQSLQSSVFEGLMVISRSSDCHHLVPNTWRETMLQLETETLKKTE